MDNIIKKTLENLEKNNMASYYVETKEEIIPLLKELIEKGSTIGVGGSETLNQIGALDFIRNGDYEFFDRYEKGLSPEQISEVIVKALSADVFLSSSNAVTENGELYNVDGRGNRVAAFCFGPKSVIVIVGANKIVLNIEAAVERVKKIAAPKNTVRLACKTPCAKTGECISLRLDNPKMCDGCLSDDRICISYLISGRQRIKNRIKVIICKESLGY
jgi:L-lactate utilization protein LutB